MAAAEAEINKSAPRIDESRKRKRPVDNSKVFGEDADNANQAQTILSIIHQTMRSRGTLGAASAALRNALSLPEGSTERALAFVEGKILYDHATSEVQNQGEEIDIAKQFPTAAKALFMGRDNARF